MSKTSTAEPGMRSSTAGERNYQESSSTVFGILKACVKLTNSIFSIRHVRRDDDPSLLSCAQSLQGFIHPLDHVSHPDVGVICAVTLVADKETLLTSQKNELLSKEGELHQVYLESKAVPSRKVPL